MAFESGKRTTVAKPISPADTTIYLASVPTVTSGRLYLKNDAQEERISFSGVSWNTVTGCYRNLSKVNDPVTSWVWLTRVAWTVVKLVAMHDQIVDKASNNTRTWTQTFTNATTFSSTINTKGITFTGTDNAWLRLKSLTTAQRDALTPNTWDQIYNSTTGTVQTYYGWTWNDAWTSTTPNASTTVAGKVEKATSGEVTAWTSTGWTGAELFVWPAEMKSVIDWLTQARAFGNWSDWDVTINSGTTTLSKDMYYNNLTITSPWILNTNWYRVFVSWTFSGNGTISRNWNNWWSASWWTWWSAGTTLGQWSLNMEKSAWAWANSPANGSAGIAWSAWTSSNPSMTNISWVAWWAWWSAAFWWWAWWSAGTSTRWSSYNTYWFAYAMHLATAQLLPTALSYWSIASSWGWWSWATNGSVSATWWGWWWGGGNGWFVRIASKIWNFIWTITATWGNWWNWGNAAVSWIWWAGWGWWWGWGNWGIILRMYYELLNDCTKILTWWTGWAWGALAGNGSNWSAWTNWNTWETISIQI